MFSLIKAVVGDLYDFLRINVEVHFAWAKSVMCDTLCGKTSDAYYKGLIAGLEFSYDNWTSVLTKELEKGLNTPGQVRDDQWGRIGALEVVEEPMRVIEEFSSPNGADVRDGIDRAVDEDLGKAEAYSGPDASDGDTEDWTTPYDLTAGEHTVDAHAHTLERTRNP